jgi:hypothetical protein
MPLLDAHHDLAHPVEDDTAWSESYYFNAYDPPSDTGFFTRIGVRPNEGTMDVSMSLWLPDGDLGEHHFIREQDGMVDSVLEVGHVRYEMLEAMKSWRLTMDGEVQARPARDQTAETRPVPVKLDATFEALTPAVGVDGQSRERQSSGASSATANTIGKGHLEQAGRWSGSLTIDGTVHTWSEARGNRDKSWGPRRWGGPRMWRWFSINVGDNIHFGGIRIGTDAGDLHRGWVWDGERATSIREWQVRTELEDDGLTHRATHVTATDKSGREHVLRGELLRVAAMGRRGRGSTTILNEGLARWDYQGRTGFGIAEYLHQLGEDGRPIVPIE